MLDILFWPVKDLLNIKPETVKALGKLKIHNMRDLLFYTPYSYLIKDLNPKLSSLKDGQLIQTEVIVKAVAQSVKKGPTRISVFNETGSILLIFFNKIPPFIFSRLKINNKIIVCGKVQVFDNYFQITHPEFIFKSELAQMYEPIYSLSYALSNKQLYSYILRALQIFEEKVITKITELELNKYLKKIFSNLSLVHLYKFDLKPHDISSIWDECRICLAYFELLANQTQLIRVRQSKQTKTNQNYAKARDLQQTILAQLNFVLTDSQQEVIAEIEKDQQAPLQMMRLMQGDVGSGKTLVALLTMLNAVNANIQTVLMAPTDLLANQHYQFFSKALSGRNINVNLLTGKTPLKDRKQIHNGLENGNIAILIGTHALFQEKVNFINLGYIVIDEQHKFGVQQRLELINKANHPDVLVMTATPIPRSLTLTMFGDMASSKLKHKPANRLPIITTNMSTSKTFEVINSLSKKMCQNEQIYWVCPLIDQNDEDLSDTERNIHTDVNSRFAVIDQQYPGTAAIIHGRMKSAEKDAVMERFKKGEIKILVATTVIEVGIDVPQATLIIIENAEKFGLAQLHQLRGRVGRGDKQSYCILLYNSQRLSTMGRKRLEVMKTSSDGFFIAEEDMKLRGSGEILGTKQSGEPEFFFADIIQDTKLLEKACEDAKKENVHADFQIKLFARQTQDLVKSG